VYQVCATHGWTGVHHPEKGKRRVSQTFTLLKKNIRFFSQLEKPYRVGFATCVGEKTLKNPYFEECT
jgi:hypothetical protein